ncbi:MAG: hypothetical protein IJX47_07345 [Clostridia bacterium]|nr:hypothetical protein [Clostridia bacterium]
MKHKHPKTTKRWIVALSLLLILALTLVGCAYPSDTAASSGESTEVTTTEPAVTTAPVPPADGTDFTALSEAFKAEIEQAYAETLNLREFPGWYAEGDGVVHYYGTYNNCVILYQETLTDSYEYKKVGEELFCHTSGFNIFTYRGGQIVDLSEAYEDGWVDDAAISEIAEQHQLMLKNYFGERYDDIYADLIESYNNMMNDLI